MALRPIKLTPKPWMVLLATVVALALKEHHAVPQSVQSGEPAYALVTLATIAISVALSFLAAYLLRQKNKATLKDDKPTTLVTRGAWMNWVLGVRRVGPIFAWAGLRRFTEEEAGGGGGKGGVGDAPKQKIWHEEGWHLLCVGPAFCLHRILSNGRVIFSGPISRESHPSGSFIDLGKEGGFSIYWGEATQPANASLGSSSRVGITSRWPYHCYVHWNDKRLGPAANWPLLDYEVEVRVESTNLSNSEEHILPTRTLTGSTVAIDSVDLSGTTDKFVLLNNQVSKFPAKSLVRLTGNACPDQDLEVLFSQAFTVQVGFFTFDLFTNVHFADGALTGCDDAGTIQAYDQEKNFGINGAHAIDTMLHSTWPRGLGLPTSGTFQAFDLDSLEDLGVLLDENNENLRTSWIALDGDSVQTVLGAGLQDLGVMMPVDPDSGLNKFVAIREPSGTLDRIRSDLLVGELPETEVFHAERPTDRITFSFPDRNLVDRDGTIAVMDDGQVSYFETQHARNVQITITTDFETASSIAQRRSQEELAGGVVTKIKANRGARTLVPGDAITVDALPEIQRVISIKLNPDSNVVALELMADFYGVSKSQFVDTPPPETGDIQAVEPDLQKTFAEVSEYLLGANQQTIIVPRIRAHSQIFSAVVHISRDNVTYTLQGTDFNLFAGGTLDEALPAPNTGGAGDDPGGLVLEENGPEFTALGPDISTVLDLSSDLTNWRLGRQVALINSSAGQELCFLRNISAIGGSTWRLDGLVRARFETLALDHPAGAEVYIFQQARALTFQDPLLVPLEDLFAKTQPQGGGVLPLDADMPVGAELYGRALSGRPVLVGALAVTAPQLVNAYQTGDDVTVRWDYGTPQQQSAAAGLQGAGTAITGVPSPDEDFVLEVRDAPGTTLLRTENPATNTFTYTNVNILADHAGEPTFQIWVYQRRGGLLSDPVKLTVERI